jgi:hypothetical protein
MVHRQPETHLFRVAVEAVRGPVWTVEPFQKVLSQMQSSVAKSAADFQPRLRSDTQGLIDETDLADDISLSQPPDLTFSDHVHRLISTYRVYRTSHRTKPEASGNPLLDESMVLLHDIVQIRSRSTAATCAQFTSIFHAGRAGLVNQKVTRFLWVPERFRQPTRKLTGSFERRRITLCSIELQPPFTSPSTSRLQSTSGPPPILLYGRICQILPASLLDRGCGLGSPETLRRLSFASVEMRLWRVLFCGLQSVEEPAGCLSRLRMKTLQPCASVARFGWPTIEWRRA